MNGRKANELGYKELQELFKQIALRSALDADYRQLCLTDSREAVRQLAGEDREIPEEVIFCEEDEGAAEQTGLFFVLPPVIKKSWLISPKGEQEND